MGGASPPAHLHTWPALQAPRVSAAREPVRAGLGPSACRAAGCLQPHPQQTPAASAAGNKQAIRNYHFSIQRLTYSQEGPVRVGGGISAARRNHIKPSRGGRPLPRIAPLFLGSSPLCSLLRSQLCFFFLIKKHFARGVSPELLSCPSLWSHTLPVSSVHLPPRCHFLSVGTRSWPLLCCQRLPQVLDTEGME